MTKKSLAAVVGICLLVGALVWMWSFDKLRTNGEPAISEAPLFQQQDPPRQVSVYYASEDGALEPEARVVFQSAQRINQMKQTLMEAFKPPVDLTHAAVVPEGVVLRELYVDAQGTAYVDCSAELASNHPGGSAQEWYTVQALTAALVQNFEEVKAVRLLVEGEPVETLKGHVELAYPLGVDASLVRSPLALTLP